MEVAAAKAIGLMPVWLHGICGEGEVGRQVVAREMWGEEVGAASLDERQWNRSG
jgi:hypothetical protein